MSTWDFECTSENIYFSCSQCIIISVALFSSLEKCLRDLQRASASSLLRGAVLQHWANRLVMQFFRGYAMWHKINTYIPWLNHLCAHFACFRLASTMRVTQESSKVFNLTLKMLTAGQFSTRGDSLMTHLNGSYRTSIKFAIIRSPLEIGAKESLPQPNVKLLPDQSEVPRDEESRNWVPPNAQRWSAALWVNQANVFWALNFDQPPLTALQVLYRAPESDMSNLSIVPLEILVIKMSTRKHMCGSLDNVKQGMKKCMPENMLTLFNGSTMNAPPPAASMMMARNFGLTAQKLESHDCFVILMLS